MAKKNSDTTYKNATLLEGKKEQLISDKIDNLYMRLRSGKDEVRKSWQFNYHHPLTKKRIKLTLGSYPALSLADARKKATSYHELLEKKIDPQEFERTNGINALDSSKVLFRDAAQIWINDIVEPSHKKKVQAKIDGANERAKKRGEKKASEAEINSLLYTMRYKKDILGRIENHILPAIGDIPLTQLKTIIVKEKLKRSEATGMNMSKICQNIVKIMDHAVDLDIIESHSLARLSRTYVNKTERRQPTIEPDQLDRFMIAMSERNMTNTTRAAMEMQLHSLSRASETAMMRWDEIDEKKNCIIIPHYRMKRARQHYIPITKYMQGILDYMRPISGELEYIFPSDSRSKVPHVGTQSVNMAMKRAGFGGEFVSHGFRSVGSTFLNAADDYTEEEVSFNSDVIEACLAHLVGTTIMERYNNAKYLKKRREMLTFWGDYIVERTAHYHSIAARFK
ncbi:integrase [Vibrio vulnificus]|uniref:tyrosine-type recombinase/integrase n=1 Tax=Vibrio TaxID=662 RepID=UPI00034D3BFC|nr:MULTISPECIES: integrase arm-type DNA-binding domain-containing protein [Vibrio]EWS67295.1 integrase [Vibrio vulnificus BAA87]KFK59718.1 integrase [Vibrio vulnificus]KFK62024.1 integrase [Vibrio vulnificus]KFK67745.1 integrase [Vibrio vulnificus]NHE84507.1 tyrosine-type recombinase/integrase [Vibrio vulnificus]